MSVASMLPIMNATVIVIRYSQAIRLWSSVNSQDRRPYPLFRYVSRTRRSGLRIGSPIGVLTVAMDPSFLALDSVVDYGSS